MHALTFSGVLFNKVWRFDRGGLHWVQRYQEVVWVLDKLGHRSVKLEYNTVSIVSAHI